MSDATAPVRSPGPATGPPGPAGLQPPMRQHGRRRRGAFWAGVLAALVALIGGGLAAITTYASASSPESTATAYFHALGRGDAAGALALGDVPPGPRTFLTADVLHAALKIAKISDVRVLSVRRSGDTADVALQYRLGFAASPVAVTDAVRMVRHGRDWRLATTAVPVRLKPRAGSARLHVDGAKLPSGRALFFPGALPVGVDTPNLQLALDAKVVHLNDKAPSALELDVSDAGKQRVGAAVTAAVRACLAEKSPGPCPRPADHRVVPGSIHGTLTADPASQLSVTVGPGVDGVIDFTGTVDVRGSYRRLDFNNIAVPKQGRVGLAINGHCYASDPSKIVWERAS